MVTRTEAEWGAFGASVTGAAHEQSGLPNQDAFTIRRHRDGIVAAVADGHGGSRFVRSQLGARFAVEVAARTGTAALESDTAPPDASALTTQVVDGWRDRVAGHVAAHPLTASEVAAVGDRAASAPQERLAYGTTLLMVVVTRRYGLLVQIGDGDIVIAHADGSVTTPVPDDGRNIASHTTSLCMDDTERHFRSAVLTGGGWPADVVLLATDGYGNAFVDPLWREQTMRDYLRLFTTRNTSSVEAGLPVWLADSAAAGGDDTTVVLLHRLSLGVDERQECGGGDG